MSNLRQAAEMALDALENHTAIKHPNQIHYRDSAIEALRAALAEEALQRLTDVQQDIEAALAEPNKCTHGVTDKNCKECYMAEPEQEPVAWMWRDGTVTSDPDRADGTWTPLYTTPPQREPLTDEEIEVLAMDIDGTPKIYLEFARDIEWVHGIKGKA